MLKRKVPVAPLGLRVLVVEDEVLLRWSVKQTLSAGPHTVLEASDAQSALRMLRGATAPIDVVLLDYRLPDSQDLRLLSDVRQTSPQSAVVMMTAFDTPEMVAEALALGAYVVLGKPFDMERLEPVLLKAYVARFELGAAPGALQ
jgi:DNA-binding NtrC family response regulator